MMAAIAVYSLLTGAAKAGEPIWYLDIAMIAICIFTEYADIKLKGKNKK
jgi:hypothetical protein